MDFKEYLDEAAKEIDRDVDKILDKEIKEAKKINKKLVPLLEAFAASCMGGKRIRGTLVILGYELTRSVILNEVKDLSRMRVSNKLRDSSLVAQNDILQIAAAYEIFHAAILAHDDIMDKSETRREKPSLYKKVGISEAITLGDFGFFLAFKIIPNSMFSSVALDTAIGQLLDLKKANPLITARFKTAQYTISGPLQLGASLAGANTKMLKLIGEFGENLGIAYQIRDDILDGDSNELNKAKKYIALAKKMITRLTKDKKMSKLLEQMGEYLIERKS